MTEFHHKKNLGTEGNRILEDRPKMDAAANLSLFTHIKHSKPSSLLPANSFSFLNLNNCILTEQQSAFGCLALLHILPFQTTNLSIRASVKRRFTSFSQRNVSGKAFHEDGNTMYKSSETRPSNRERLVSLFKRIQISISEQDSGIKSAINVSHASRDGDSSLEASVVEFLQQSTKETKDKNDLFVKSNSIWPSKYGCIYPHESTKKAKVKHNEDKPSTRRTKKEIKPIVLSEPQVDFKPTRLPSNFVRRSPIPSPTPLRNKGTSVTEDNKIDSETQRKLSEIKEMKLTELKQLAKQTRIRGYSKLNKTHLLELLISQMAT